MGLQFNLWGAFREWGENTDDAEWAGEPEDMLDDAGKLRKSINLAKLYGSLVADGVLSLQILKVYLKLLWSLMKKGPRVYKFATFDEDIPRSLLHPNCTTFSGR